MPHYVPKCTNTYAMFIVMCTYKNNAIGTISYRVRMNCSF